MTIARTICLGFITVILVGSLFLTMPFSLNSGEWGSFVTALFTSTSAVCVTGLIVEDTGTYYSFWGQLVIVFLISVGGLGYMTTTTFLILIIGKKFDLHHKFAIKDSFDRPFVQGSRSLIQSIVATTCLFELLGIIFLFNFFYPIYGKSQGLWQAIFHSISAWNNAGFSLFKDSLMEFQDSLTVNIVISILIIFGGIGYQVIIESYFWLETRIRTKNKQKYCFSLNFKVVTSTTILLLVIGLITFWITESQNPETMGNASFSQQILRAWFQSVTTRTAGFNSIDIGKMTTAGLFLTIGLMFVGASPSGTGGGIKTTTLRILTNCTRSVLQGKEEVILYQREVPVSLILKAMAVVFGSAITVVVVTFLISFLESNVSFITILFEVVSAFATVGLSTGITASLSTISKFILILTMYIGRVGVLLFMAAILGDPKPTRIKYPEENLLVG